MKTKYFLAVLIILCAFTYSVSAQNKPDTLKKDKFHLNKNGEDKIGYAQAVKVGNTIYISGSTGGGNMEDALKLAYDDIEKTLKSYNATFQNVVKENLYTTALDSVIKYKDLRSNYYGSDYPAATWVEVRRLYSPKEIIEIEVIAVLPVEKEQ